MKSRYNPVLIAVIIIGLVCSLWINYNRHAIEENNNTVEMAMEYENLCRLAALEGLPEDTVLAKFREAGVTSLMVFDTNLQRLSRKGVLQVATGGSLRQAQTLGLPPAGPFASVTQPVENAVYVAPNGNLPAFWDTVEDLQLRFGAERVLSLGTEEAPLVQVLGSTTLVPPERYDEPLGVLQAPLGLSVLDLQKVEQAGFHVIIRPSNYLDVDAEKIDSIFQRVEKSGVEVHAYMPCGREVVGYPDQIDYMAERMGSRKLIMLEHYTQLRFADIKGLVPLAEALDYNVARSYIIDGLEQKKISVAEALRRWALTDEERNIRVNYVRPFYMSKEGKDLMTLNLEYVQDIVASVEDRGFTIGQAGVFQALEENAGYREGYNGPYLVNKLSLLPLMAAIVAAGVIYLSLLCQFSRTRELLLWLVLTLAAGAILLAGRGLLLRQVMALGAAVLFPVLSMNYILDLWDKRRNSQLSVAWTIFHCCWQLALAIALSLVGGSFLAAVLADGRFLLEIDIYRGVKLTFLLPLVLMTLLFAKRYQLLADLSAGWPAFYKRATNLLNTKLTLKYVVLGGIVLLVLLYFVGRSGHTGGVPVAAIELKLRAFLEQVLYARPRQKEFMIGHPAFFLAAYAAYQGAPKLWQYALTCGALIGQASLVQTFCHMRTPVLMSFIRALDGYACGAVLGCLLLLVAAVGLHVLMKLKRRYLV